MDDGQIEVDVYKHDSKSFSRRPAMRFVDRGHRVDSIGTGDPVEIDEQSWLINVLREQHAIWFDRRFVDWTALEVLLRHTDLRSLMVSTLRKV